MRKPIIITLPADEAAQLCAMLVGMEQYYEHQAEKDGMDPADARGAKALAIAIADRIMAAMVDQLTPEEVDRLTGT